MWEKIKQHPWIVGGVVGFLLLVVVLSSSSSSTTAATTSTGTDASGTGNGDQLQAYLAAINQQGQTASLAAGVQNQQTAAAVQVATLQAGTADNANTLAAQVAEYETKILGDVQTNRDTMTAQTQQAQIQAGVTNTQTVANALVQENQINASTQQAWIKTLPAIVGTQASAQVAVAQAQRPCSSYLFGLISSC